MKETVKEFATLLDGREIGEEVTREECTKAKESGLVICYGASDDLVELEGAIYDELGAYNGTEFHVTKKGLLRSECDSEDRCPYFKELKDSLEEKATEIKAIWNDSGNPCWRFETSIPHATFQIMEEGEVFCVGIVFAMADLVEVKSA